MARQFFILTFCLLLAFCNGFCRHFGKVSFKANRLSMLSDTSDAPVIHQVFVGNLPFTYAENQLSDLVSEKISSFSSLKIAIDKKSGKSRGFGYINFDDKEAAEAAVSALGGLQVDGRDLKIDLAGPYTERAPRTMGSSSRAPFPPQENSAFVGNIDFKVQEDDIMAMCNDLLGVGVATRIRIAVDKQTGRARGFGHIDFNSPDDVAKAIDVLNGVTLSGRELRVNAAQRKSDLPPRDGMDSRERAPRMSKPSFDPKPSIFIGNLAWGVSQELIEDMLTDVLGQDSFLQVRLATDRETGRLRGFGHVDFKDAESAEKALVELDGMELLGRQLRADLAQRKAPGERSGGAGGDRRPQRTGGDRYGGSSDDASFGAW